MPSGGQGKPCPYIQREEKASASERSADTEASSLGSGRSFFLLLFEGEEGVVMKEIRKICKNNKGANDGAF
ncbi:MAG: hypothetical protein WCO51_05605 [bacterium]